LGELYARTVDDMPWDGFQLRGTEGLSKEKPKDTLELYYKATAGIACGCAGMDSPATLCMNEPLPVQKKI
jgi:hypothetical protein